MSSAAERAVAARFERSPCVGHNGRVLIYDGDCAFCTTAAHWLEDHLATPITVVPWQQIHHLDELGLTVEDVSTAVYWVDAYGRTSRGHLGVARALTMTKGPLAVLGWIGLVPPFTWATAPLYRLAARYRHRLPGATEACRMPTSPTSFRPPAPAADAPA